MPILRFLSLSTGIQVDLNCNNLVGIRNSHLLQCYSRGEAQTALGLAHGPVRLQKGTLTGWYELAN